MENKGAMRVFVSASARDAEARDELLLNLAPLSVEVWHAGLVGPGEDPRAAAAAALAKADAALVLLSASYLATDGPRWTELPRILDAQRDRGLRVLPVLVSPCLWDTVDGLKALEPLPRDRRPLLGRADREARLVDIATALGAPPRATQAAGGTIAPSSPAPATTPPASPTVPPRAARNASITAALVLLLLLVVALLAHKPSNPPPDVSLRHLPVVTAKLIGRDPELKQLDAAWASQGKTRIVPIVAMGGLGKSTLVVSWLKRLGEKGFPGARRVFAYSFFSQGARDERASSADPFFAEALPFFGDPHPTHANSFEAADHLRDILRKERSILVIDGLEPLQHPPGAQEGQLKDRALAGLLEELAIQGPGLVIITSREKLTDLAAYEGGAVKPIELERHSKEAGIQILRGLGVPGADAELGEAVESFQGHALALTLLGPLLVERYGGDIRRYKEIPDVFASDAQGPQAKRAMAAYDPWLTGPERSILRLLGLFDRPAPAAALDALRKPAFRGLNDAVRDLAEPEWNQALSRLRKLSLVAPASASEEPTVDAHPLVREFFGAALKKENEDAWKEGHWRLYRWYADRAPYRPDTMGEMEPLYAAVMHGCRAGMYQEAFDEVFWKRIRRGKEAYSIKKLGAFGADLSALAGFFEEPWTRPVTALREDWRSFVLAAAGFALRALGRLPEAVAPMRASLQGKIAEKDWQQAAAAASNLSELHLTLGQLPAAIETARQSVELADRSGDAFWRMVSRTTRADALHQAGQPDEAARLFREAEALQKEDQPEFPLLYSLQGYHYCDLLLSRGEAEAVLRRAETALQIVLNGSRNLLDIGLNHLALARAHLALHPNAPETRTHFDEAVARLREAGNQSYLPWGLLHRAAFHRQRHELAAATRDLDEALRLATRGQMRLHEADARLERTRLRLAEKDPKEARAELDRARSLITQMGYGRRTPEVAALEGSLAAGR